MQIEIDLLLARCDETIAKLKDDLRLEERLRQRLLEIKGVPTLPQAGSPEKNPGGGNGGYRPAGKTVSGSLLSHVIEVMRGEGRQMRAREIAGRVEARGYTTTAKGGLKIAVSTVLAHNQGKLFRKIEPGVYTLLRKDKEVGTNQETQ
jgi:hypothetical protein